MVLLITSWVFPFAANNLFLQKKRKHLSQINYLHRKSVSPSRKQYKHHLNYSSFSLFMCKATFSLLTEKLFFIRKVNFPSGGKESVLCEKKCESCVWLVFLFHYFSLPFLSFSLSFSLLTFSRSPPPESSQNTFVFSSNENIVPSKRIWKRSTNSTVFV